LHTFHAVQFEPLIIDRQSVLIPKIEIITLHFSDPTLSGRVRYNEALLAQARTTAACNISHGIEARFCRWLLQSRDCAESDTVPLTQEFLSEMLGVRRTSVTEIAVKMQENGVISYSRGIINVVDLAKLKELSCECYETLRGDTANQCITSSWRDIGPLSLVSFRFFTSVKCWLLHRIEPFCEELLVRQEIKGSRAAWSKRVFGTLSVIVNNDCGRWNLGAAKAAPFHLDYSEPHRN
jgi:hypothetical protein